MDPLSAIHSTLTSTSNPSDRPLCAFCGRSFSQYTCPSCNAGYCSLACYRSEAHSQCTESFYRKAVEDQIRTEPNSTVEDRRQMMEMLKRLEEDTVNNEIAEGSSEDIDDGDLSLGSRLAHLNMDEVDIEGLWAVLSEHEKEAFNSAIQDPMSERAQEMLAVHDLEVQSFRPWWEDSVPATSTLARDDPPSSRALRKRPQLMQIPLSPPKAQIESQPSLVYNMFAITLAYAFATRHLVASPLSTVVSDEVECVAAREDIGKSAPFLVERRSTMVFGSVDQVVTEVWSRMDSMSNTSLIHLLKDAVVLLGASPVTLVDDESFASATPLLLLLSDLHALFASWSPPKETHLASVTSPPNPPTIKSKVNYIAMKVTFYAARAAATSTASFAQLGAEIERKIAAMYNEAHGVGEAGKTAQRTPTVGDSLILDSLRGIQKARSGASSARLVQELA